MMETHLSSAGRRRRRRTGPFTEAQLSAFAGTVERVREVRALWSRSRVLRGSSPSTDIRSTPSGRASSLGYSPIAPEASPFP
jgi:hypothetical protein